MKNQTKHFQHANHATSFAISLANISGWRSHRMLVSNKRGFGWNEMQTLALFVDHAVNFRLLTFTTFVWIFIAVFPFPSKRTRTNVTTGHGRRFADGPSTARVADAGVVQMATKT